MSSDLVTYELDGAVAVIGLNRPKKRNAINNAVVAQLRDAVVRAGEEADAGVIFGHGVNFSAGLDLEELLKRMDPATPRPRKKPNHAWHTVFDIIARGPIPFVAALHGAVVGGGRGRGARTRDARTAGHRRDRRQPSHGSRGWSWRDRARRLDRNRHWRPGPPLNVAGRGATGDSFRCVHPYCKGIRNVL